MAKSNMELVFDYKQQNATDKYYRCVELEGGRFGWTGSILVEQ